MAYQGGVAVAITLAAIYAEQVIGFEKQETMVLIFVLNIAAFAGAFVFGYIQDRIGHKRALALTLWGWMLTCLIAALSTTKGQFWWAASIAGVCLGSSQSAGRAMAGLMVPPQRLGEFFGLWTFAVRLASILGPLSYGLITWLSGGNQRLAIGSTSLLFVLGLVLLMPINVERGRRMALGQAEGQGQRDGVRVCPTSERPLDFSPVLSDRARDVDRALGSDGTAQDCGGHTPVRVRGPAPTGPGRIPAVDRGHDPEHGRLHDIALIRPGAAPAPGKGQIGRAHV